jgi:hypothetical protein
MWSLKTPILTQMAAILSFEVVAVIVKRKWYLHWIPYPWKLRSGKNWVSNLYTFQVMTDFLICRNGGCRHFGYWGRCCDRWMQLIASLHSLSMKTWVYRKNWVSNLYTFQVMSDFVICLNGGRSSHLGFCDRSTIIP